MASLPTPAPPRTAPCTDPATPLQPILSFLRQLRTNTNTTLAFWATTPRADFDPPQDIQFQEKLFCFTGLFADSLPPAIPSRHRSRNSRPRRNRPQTCRPSTPLPYRRQQRPPFLDQFNTRDKDFESSLLPSPLPESDLHSSRIRLGTFCPSHRSLHALIATPQHLSKSTTPLASPTPLHYHSANPPEPATHALRIHRGQHRKIPP